MHSIDIKMTWSAHAQTLITYPEGKGPRFTSLHGVPLGRPAREVVVESVNIRHAFQQGRRLEGREWRGGASATVRPVLASGALGKAFDAHSHGRDSAMSAWLRGLEEEYRPQGTPSLVWDDDE